MSKPLLLTFAICLLTLGTFSQVGFKGGLTFGPVTSQVHGDGIAGFYKVGISAGALVEMTFTERIGSRLEILYTPKGSRSRPDSLNQNYYKLSLQYVEIPLSINFNYDKFQFDAGIYTGILIRQREFFSPGIAFAPNPPYNTIDVGGHIGCRYMLGEKWFAHARYSQSILPIRSAPKDNQVSGTYKTQGTNFDFRLMFGVLF
ncbi:MAG: hypothetical protein ACI84C_002599 [Flavobacteriales bacterium]|jgi:hypothetical protein